MLVAAALGIIALLLVIEACVFGLSAATGLALHWSSLIIAAALSLIAAASFAKGKAARLRSHPIAPSIKSSETSL